MGSEMDYPYDERQRDVTGGLYQRWSLGLAADVFIENVQNNQALLWNSITERWENQPIASNPTSGLELDGPLSASRQLVKDAIGTYSPLGLSTAEVSINTGGAFLFRGASDIRLDKVGEVLGVDKLVVHDGASNTKRLLVSGLDVGTFSGDVNINTWAHADWLTLPNYTENWSGPGLDLTLGGAHVTLPAFISFGTATGQTLRSYYNGSRYFTLTLQDRDFNTTQNDWPAVDMATGTWTHTSGEAAAVRISPVWSDTLTGGAVDLHIDSTESSRTASGTHYFIKADLGGVERWSVDKLGNVSTFFGSYTLKTGDVIFGIDPAQQWHIGPSGTSLRLRYGSSPTTKWTFNSSSLYFADYAPLGQPAMLEWGTSDTQPSLVPSYNDDDTGIGHGDGSNLLNLISGGASRLIVKTWECEFTTPVKVQSAATIYSGSGTPEGAVQGYPGDLYLRTDGGAGTSMYVKESGVDTTTGWVAK